MINILKNLTKKEKLEPKQEEGIMPFQNIDPYSYCIVNPYFKASENFSKIFSDFENRISSLQRYFEMNRNNIEKYLKFSKTELADKKQQNITEKDLRAFSRCYFSDEEYFYEMHYLSILLMLFSLFETLLSEVSNDLSKTQNKKIDNFSDSSLPYVKKYLYFLDKVCKLNLNLDDETLKKLDIIRKLRNNYLHSLEKDIPENIQEELMEMLEIDTHKLVINNEIITMAFEVIGGISQKLEVVYWEDKKKKFKIR